MRHKLVVLNPSAPPVIDLISLEDFKEATGITDCNADDRIQAWITRTSDIIATECDRVFALQNVAETFTFRMLEVAQTLNLARYPVLDIESIEVGGSPVTDWDFNNESGILWRTGNGFWAGEIVVAYTGGYDLPDGAPPALAQAAIEQVNALYDAAMTGVASNVREISHGDVHVGFWSTAAAAGGTSTMASLLLPSVLESLRPFKRYTA